MHNFVYPAILAPEEQDGGFVITFRDVPEAITQGESIKEALVEAADCLEEAIANRIAMDMPIPVPTRLGKRTHPISLPIQMAAKAALYLAIREANITKVELAKRLECDEKEVRRLLDPRHPFKLPRIEAALAVVGRQLVVGLQNAA
jgi:antitoxin HicB